MRNRTTICFTVFLVSSLFLLTSCTSLRDIDDGLGKIFSGEISPKTEESNTEDIKKVGEWIATSTDLVASMLTKEQKEVIDKWLEDKGLNRYGDALETFYKGGTPLFDEVSGEVKERYEYILEKNPDIINKIKETYDQQQ